MADKKISELTTASEIKNGDNIELSQDTGSGLVSLKATILAIANKMLKGINFTSDLQTTEKTVIGAINEVAQGGGGGGSSTLNGLNDVDIDDTTLADGQALVYNGISEKWVNGQGGGGTGGHTIIDENGTSMTARAGLQFVGADVSDDATNNKTIVDLASAGGIDGVFIDIDNEIQASTTIPANTTATYTATEDCCVRTQLWGKTNNSSSISIDGIEVGTIYNVNGAVYYIHYLKKGQTISFTVSAQSAYTVYGIQTGTTHSKFQPVIYSLEEREIGVWKDGRPLYQKTVDFGTLPNNTTKTVSYNISDLDYFVMVQCVAHNQNGSRNIPFVDDAYKSGDVLLDTIKSSGVIRIIAHTDLSSLTGDVTLQYVKTTDVAGSGSWTPQGVPAVHYSTDEQIIGTYLGETLYEKTIVVSALSIGENTINHLISGISEIIKVEGKANYSGDCINMPYTSTVNGYVIGIQANATRILINVGASFNANDFSNISITLKYTKSS